MRELTTQQLKDERERAINTIDWCQAKITANQQRIEWIENCLQSKKVVSMTIDKEQQS